MELGFAAYYKRKDNTPKYLEYADRAIVNKDLDEETQTKLLVSYLQDVEGDTSLRKHSVEIVRKVIALHPNNALLHGVMGDLLSMQGLNREALESYKQSLRLDSTNLNTWQQVMFGMTGKEDADSLISYSNTALTLFPASAVVYYLNGIGYSNKGAYDKAAKAITTAIDFQPEDNKVLLAEMYASLADVYHSGKAYADADKNFDKALELTPDNATVLNNYAYYLSVRKTRLEDAERFSAKSLLLRPDEPTFLDTYGWIFYQQGKYEKAAELIGKAVQKEGANADATLYEHLGDAYFKMNQIDKALQNWQKASEKDPANTQLQQKIKNRKTDD
ncbi:MAG: tetratricopeptide repeat protein [Chitinophagaceae bacterium]